MPRKRNRIDQFYYKNQNMNDECDRIRKDIVSFLEKNKDRAVYILGLYDIGGVTAPFTIRCIQRKDPSENVTVFSIEDAISTIRTKILDLLYNDPWVPIYITIEAFNPAEKENDHIIYGLQKQIDVNNRIRNILRWERKKENTTNTMV